MPWISDSVTSERTLQKQRPFRARSERAFDVGRVTGLVNWIYAARMVEVRALAGRLATFFLTGAISIPKRLGLRRSTM